MSANDHYCRVCDHPKGYHADPERGCSMPLAADGTPVSRTQSTARICGCKGETTEDVATLRANLEKAENRLAGSVRIETADKYRAERDRVREMVLLKCDEAAPVPKASKHYEDGYRVGYKSCQEAIRSVIEAPHDQTPESASAGCTCDGAAYFTPQENRVRIPFIRSAGCPFHGEDAPPLGSPATAHLVAGAQPDQDRFDQAVDTLARGYLTHGTGHAGALSNVGQIRAVMERVHELKGECPPREELNAAFEYLEALA